jgi:predicted transposase/invertase (TIGR01784 family)
MENIHDKFVKTTFSDTNRAISFFEKFLPEELLSSLELNSLQYLQESYLTDDLKARISDMVFEVKAKGKPDEATDIVLLFEHKSSPDRNVLIQVGLYMFSHWWKCVREKKPLKPIIPIIYYQGKKKWKVKTMLELFSKISGQVPLFIPEIRHIFMALHTLKDDEIASIRNKMMATAVMAQKNVFDPIIFAKDLEKIFTLFPVKVDDGNFLKTIFVYLIKVSEVPKTEWAKALNTIPSDIKENLMTTYTWMKEEGIQEGLQKGRQEGRQEGILEKETEVILQGYEEGLNIHLLAKITKLSEQEVIKILKEHQKIKD